MNIASAYKGIGYSVSTLSVILLGIVAWQSAAEQPLLLACLIAGMGSSIGGMALRWVSHRIDREEKERIEAKAEAGSFSGRFPAPGWDSPVPAGESAAHAQGPVR